MKTESISIASARDAGCPVICVTRYGSDLFVINTPSIGQIIRMDAAQARTLFPSAIAMRLAEHVTGREREVLEFGWSGLHGN